MSDKQLFFVLSDPNEKERLAQYVAERNQELYQQPEFALLETPEDKHLIVAASLALGPGQLGLFPAKEFKKGEVIIKNRGKNLFGKLPFNELKTKVEQFKESGDYIWTADCGDGMGVATDSRLEGSLARFINLSDYFNAEPIPDENGDINFVAKEDIVIGKEITVNYGKGYFMKQERSNNQLWGESLIDSLTELAIAKHIDIFQEHGTRQDSANNLEKIQFLYEKIWGKKIQIRKTDFPKYPKDHLYLETSDEAHPQPLLFNLDNDRDLEHLSKYIKYHTIIERSSSKSFYVAPVARLDGRSRLALFTASPIKKGDVVCHVRGENLTSKEKKKRESEGRLDHDLLFLNKRNHYIYSELLSSEAHFVHGAKEKEFSNVELDENNCYIAQKDISAGEEIVTYFLNYSAPRNKITNLRTIVDNFNASQSSWKATLFYDDIKQSYYLDVAACQPLQEDEANQNHDNVSRRRHGMQSNEKNKRSKTISNAADAPSFEFDPLEARVKKYVDFGFTSFPLYEFVSQNKTEEDQTREADTLGEQQKQEMLSEEFQREARPNASFLNQPKVSALGHFSQNPYAMEKNRSDIQPSLLSQRDRNLSK